MAGAAGRRIRAYLAVVSSNKETSDDALAAAVQNAALEDIYVAEDEQELIRLHQSDEIAEAEFLRRAAELARREPRGVSRNGPGEERGLAFLPDARHEHAADSGGLRRSGGGLAVRADHLGRRGNHPAHNS